MSVLLGKRLQGPKQANRAKEPADPVARTTDQDKGADDRVERPSQEAGNCGLEPVGVKTWAVRSCQDRIERTETDAAHRDQTREAVQEPWLCRHAPILIYIRHSVEGGVTSPLGRLASPKAGRLHASGRGWAEIP